MVVLRGLMVTDSVVRSSPIVSDDIVVGVEVTVVVVVVVEVVVDVVVVGASVPFVMK